MSFETACWKIGLGPLLLDSHSGSSLSKGETQEDTVLNMAAMDPQIMIIRCGDTLDLEGLSQQISMPIINAGWGKRSHPSQALLDLYTLWKEKDLQGHRLLIVGDIVHSRVAASHFDLFKKMGVEVAVCGPQEFYPEGTKTSFHWFSQLKEGLAWCDSVMALRVQTERHSEGMKIPAQDYFQNYGLHAENLKALKPSSLILHPGPVNRGLEISEEALKDSRCRVLQQVTNGVYVRTALIRKILGII